MNLVRKSKSLSKFLRHAPEEIGLTLEEGGWVKVSDLLKGLSKKGIDLSMAELEEVVATNDKKRFSFNEDKSKIRAAQGHSVEVDLQLIEAVPPYILYHGTNTGITHLLYKEGIKPMSRQQVHLSSNKDTALKTGARKGKPVALVIRTEDMHDAGYKFYLADNGVWLTDFVPPEFIMGNEYQ